MSIFDQYFTLWDASLTNEDAYHQLLDLFAEDVVILAPQGEKVMEIKGKDVIGMGIKAQLQNYVSMKHLWNTTETETGFQATWAVAHELKSGEMHAAVGMDLIELDESGKIKFLEIRPDQNITKKI